MGRDRSLLSRVRGAVKSLAYSGLRRGRWQHPARVLAALELARGQRVVDLGAGGGYFTHRLAQAVGPTGRVYAVDPDDDLRARIDRHAARRGQSNIVTIPPHDGGIDLPRDVHRILAVNSFHHLPAERVGYFARLADTLRPDGRLAIIEPRPRWFLFGHATEPEDVRSVLTAAGYDMVRQHGFLPRQSFLVFARSADVPVSDVPGRGSGS